MPPTIEDHRCIYCGGSTQEHHADCWRAKLNASGVRLAAQPDERGQRVSAETLARLCAMLEKLDSAGKLNWKAPATQLTFDLRDARAEITRLRDELLTAQTTNGVLREQVERLTRKRDAAWCAGRDAARAVAIQASREGLDHAIGIAERIRALTPPTEGRADG